MMILVLMSEEEAEKRKLKPLGRIIATSDVAVDPTYFTIASSEVILKVIEKANEKNLYARKLKLEDIDFFDIHEAFSSIVIIASERYGIPIHKINKHGSSVALGHPAGMTGTRVLQSLLTVLKVHGAKLGIAATCNGGGNKIYFLAFCFIQIFLGGGCAILVERIY